MLGKVKAVALKPKLKKILFTFITYGFGVFDLKSFERNEILAAWQNAAGFPGYCSGDIHLQK